MDNFDNPIKTIKVCIGPGCRSWQSGKVLSLLWKVVQRFPGARDIQVFPVSCMKRCSGGVTVKMSPTEEHLKLREPEEAFEALTRRNPALIAGKFAGESHPVGTDNKK